MVNKGLTIFQWKNNLDEADKIISEALDYDADCEAAVATLAQISLQQGKVERASELFRHQVELARTEADIMNALQFAYVRTQSLSLSDACLNAHFFQAAEAQYEFAKNFPDIAQTFRYADDQARAAMMM